MDHFRPQGPQIGTFFFARVAESIDIGTITHFGDPIFRPGCLEGGEGRGGPTEGRRQFFGRIVFGAV